MGDRSWKESPWLYKAWLLLCAAGCIWISLFGEKTLPQVYLGKAAGIFASMLILLLSLCSMATGEVGALGLTDPGTGNDVEIPLAKRRKAASAFCLVFLAGTAAETAYLSYGLGNRSGLMQDSLATAAILTTAAVIARRVAVHILGAVPAGEGR